MLSGRGAWRMRPSRTNVPGRSSGVRARMWIHRAVAVAFVASSLAPLIDARPAVATSAPPQVSASQGQAQPPPKPTVAPSEKLFEDMLPEDLAGQPIYADQKAEWDRQYKATVGKRVEVRAVDYVAHGGAEGLRVEQGFEGRPGPTLVWAEDDGWVEWEFQIPETGLYEVTLDYFPIKGKRASVQRDFLINGKLLFYFLPIHWVKNITQSTIPTFQMKTTQTAGFM